MSATTIYIVRHGQSVGNRDGVLSGQTDHALTDEGRTQAKIVRELLKDVLFDEVYSSNLQRAVGTAQIIYGHPVPIEHRLRDLRERHFGVLEGKPAQRRRDQTTFHREAYDKLSVDEQWKYSHAEGMESNHELSTRFLVALQKIAAANAGKTLLVVTHGGCIRTALIKLGYATQQELPGGALKNGGYAVLGYTGKTFSVKKVHGVNPSNLSIE